jgi:acyl carrier protein
MSDYATILAEMERLIRSVTAHPALAISAASVLGDIEDLDSLRVLECVAMAERHFGVEISPDALYELETVGDIARALAASAPARRG